MNRIADIMPNAALQPPGGVLGRIATLLRGVTRPQNRSLRCLETLQLGPKRMVYLVECEGQRFLAGAGSDGIHTLVALNQQQSADAAAGDVAL